MAKAQSSSKKTAISGTEAVDEFMSKLEHPLKDEIQAVRQIILSADKHIQERVKWNAPSFYCVEDMVTIHVKATKHVHVIFHHAAIVNITSPLLEGDYKDRRMMYLNDMQAINTHKNELLRITKELVGYIC